MRDFMQAGPTCGFYCLEYAMSLQEGREPDEENVKRMLIGAIEDGRTAVGEIFTRRSMLDAFDSLYRGRGSIRMERVGGKRSVKRAMLGGSVVMPVYTSRKIPHYYVLVGRDGDEAEIYDPADRRNRRSAIETMLWMNQQIKGRFDWDEYFKARRGMGLVYFIKDHVRSCGVMGPVAQAARRNGRRLKRAGRLEGAAEVDVGGWMFVVKGEDAA